MRIIITLTALLIVLSGCAVVEQNDANVAYFACDGSVNWSHCNRQKRNEHRLYRGQKELLRDIRYGDTKVVIIKDD